MALFPALEPKGRSYSFGVFPVTEHAGVAGAVTRFRHGAVSAAHVLNLNFQDLTQAEAKLIRDHYRGQQGGYLSFALSAEAWAGHASSTDLVPATTQWRYAQPPEETHKRGGWVDMTVQLEAVFN